MHQRPHLHVLLLRLLSQQPHQPLLLRRLQSTVHERFQEDHEGRPEHEVNQTVACLPWHLMLILDTSYIFFEKKTKKMLTTKSSQK